MGSSGSSAHRSHHPPAQQRPRQEADVRHEASGAGQQRQRCGFQPTGQGGVGDAEDGRHMIHQGPGAASGGGAAGSCSLLQGACGGHGHDQSHHCSRMSKMKRLIARTQRYNNPRTAGGPALLRSACDMFCDRSTWLIKPRNALKAPAANTPPTEAPDTGLMGALGRCEANARRERSIAGPESAPEKFGRPCCVLPTSTYPGPMHGSAIRQRRLASCLRFRHQTEQCRPPSAPPPGPPWPASRRPAPRSSSSQPGQQQQRPAGGCRSQQWQVRTMRVAVGGATVRALAPTSRAGWGLP